MSQTVDSVGRNICVKNQYHSSDGHLHDLGFLGALERNVDFYKQFLGYLLIILHVVISALSSAEDFSVSRLRVHSRTKSLI